MFFEQDEAAINDINMITEAIKQFDMKYSEEDHIPSMESFLDRIGNSILNNIKTDYNLQKILTEVAGKEYNNRREGVIKELIRMIDSNPPSNEVYRTSVGRYATKQNADQYKKCLEASAKFISNAKNIIFSKDKNPITAEIKMMVEILANNKCSIDLEHPKSSHAGTRFTYSEFGRLGKSGYGDDVHMIMSYIKQAHSFYMNFFYKYMKSETNISSVLEIEHYVENFIKNKEKMTKSQSLEMAEHLKNIKIRLIAFKAILRTIVDFWQVTFMCVFDFPLVAIAQKAGCKDGLITYLMDTK